MVFGGIVALPGHVVANCEFYKNSAGGHPGGKTGTEPITGITGDMAVYGCNFHDNNTKDHTVYRVHNHREKDEWQGLVRFHDNIFDCVGGPYSFSPIGSKGRGSRIYRNKIYAAGSFGIGPEIADAKDGGTPYNETYGHHNLLVATRNAYGENGGIFLSNLSQNNPDGRGEMNAWNNTVAGCYHGMMITTNDLTRDGNTFKSYNNLFSDVNKYAADLRLEVETTEIDYNYYHKYSSFKVRGSVKDDAGWRTAGYDKNGQLNAVDPQYVSVTATDIRTRDYSLSVSSPARGTGTDVVTVIDTDPNAWIGINYVPHATSPDAGAYQYLSGKTLDFSKMFVGLKCKNGNAQRLKLWRTPKDESSLRTLTSA